LSQVRTYLVEFGVLLETPCAQVAGARRLFRVPALLGLDLEAVSVSRRIFLVVWREKRAVRRENDLIGKTVKIPKGRARHNESVRLKMSVSRCG